VNQPTDQGGFSLDSEEIYKVREAITDLYKDDTDRIEKLRNLLFSGQYEENIKQSDLFNNTHLDNSQIEWAKGCFAIYCSIIEENGQQNWLLENFDANIRLSSLLRRLLLGLEPQSEPKCLNNHIWSHCDVCRDSDCPLISKEIKLLSKVNFLINEINSMSLRLVKELESVIQELSNDRDLVSKGDGINE